MLTTRQPIQAQEASTDAMKVAVTACLDDKLRQVFDTPTGPMGQLMEAQAARLEEFTVANAQVNDRISQLVATVDRARECSETALRTSIFLSDYLEMSMTYFGESFGWFEESCLQLGERVDEFADQVHSSPAVSLHRPSGDVF